jgi:hypothetical protein
MSQPKTRKRLDELMSRIRTDYERSKAASAACPEGPYDSVYYDGTPKDDDDDWVPDGEVTILFP